MIVIEPDHTLKKGKGCEAQAIKLIQMQGFLEKNGFRSPKVFYRDHEGYVMETIHGMDAITYLHCTSPKQGTRFLQRLWEFIVAEIHASRMQTVKKEIFSEKMDQVISASCENPHAVYIVTIDKILRGLLPKFDVNLPVGVCHGDLTLSNTLLCGDDIYFIDPIPVFLESPILDAAKLIQDFRHGWTARLFGGADWERLAIMMLNVEIPLLFDPIVFRFCCALNMARILPYLKHDRKLSYYVCKEILKYG